jgi:hypothetical protein
MNAIETCYSLHPYVDSDEESLIETCRNCVVKWKFSAYCVQLLPSDERPFVLIFTLVPDTFVGGEDAKSKKK